MMKKKQQTNPPSISVLKKRKRIRTIIISVFSGIFSIAMLTWTWTNYAKSVAFNKKMLEEAKKTTDIANKTANSDLINETAKIQTFAKTNVWTENDFDSFNFSNDVKSAYNASYNKTISLIKSNSIQFMKKNNIEIKNNFDFIKLKKNVNELKYKVFDKTINSKQTIVQNVKISKNKKINSEVTKILNNLITGLGSASEKLTILTTSLGTTAGFFGALFIALAPFTAGATIIPAFILSGVITFVISVVAGISANLNSMIQGIQTISRSMIDENTSNAIAGLPLNLERQINELKKQVAKIEPHWAFVGVPAAITEIKKVIVEMEKLKNSQDLSNAVRNLLSESYNNDNDWMINNKKSEPHTKIVYINQIEKLRTISVGPSTEHKDEKLTYQWYSNTVDSTLNGIPIPGATNASYKLTASDVGSSATTKYFYVKIGESINGIPLSPIVSKTTSLIVSALPVINISNQATAQNVNVNQKTNLPTFSVIAVTSSDNENAKLTYQWFLAIENNQPIKIGGATGSSYQVTAEDTKNIGLKYFYAIVNGSINGVPLIPITSNINSLMVDNQPENLKTTLNKIVYVNQTKDLPTFSVKASVSGNWNVKFNYQWYSNTTNSNVGGTLIQGAEDKSYTIKQSDVDSSPTTKYFYVIVGGTINGVELVPVTSQAYSLSVKTVPVMNMSTGLVMIGSIK